MIDADHASGRCPSGGGGGERKAEAAAELQHPIARGDLQQLDRPFVALPIGAALGHDPSGDGAEPPLGLPELRGELGSETHERS